MWFPDWRVSGADVRPAVGLLVGESKCEGSAPCPTKLEY